MIQKQESRYVKEALFVSHTSLKDFLNCPRSYYLKNLYRNPNGNRIQIQSGPLTLGGLVHDTIKWFLQTNRTANEEQLVAQFKNHWLKYRGKRGGFSSREEEAIFGKRGLQMLGNFFKNQSVLEKDLDTDGFLKYWLTDKIVLNGRLDFLGELHDGTLHVLDFKTGAKDEEDSTQLYIYAILAESNFQKEVSKLSYWYLDRDLSPKEAVLDPLDEKLGWLLEKSLEIQKTVLAGNWVCKKDPGLCRDCRNYLAIIDDKGEFLFTDEAFHKDLYYLLPD